jgi:hypothetical protein
LHPKVLSPEAWEVVRALREGGLLDGWILAGGTGLALQLGHRYSEDLDFFRPEPFAPESLVTDLSRHGSVTVQGRAADTLHVSIGDLRISFLRAEAPLLFPGTPYRGLVIADPRDIAVMKVIAIGGRGSRKDFVDLYFYLRGGGSLEDVFALLRQRFAEIDYNEYHLLKSLMFFDDAEAEPMPAMIEDVGWETIKEAIVGAVRAMQL